MKFIDLNSKDIVGWTQFSNACINGQKYVVKVVLRHYLTNWRMKTLWFFSHEKNSWWPRIWKIPSVKLGESLEKMCLVFHALQSKLWDLLSHLGHVSFPFKWVSWVVGITYMDRTSHFSFCLSLSKYHIALKNKRKWK